MNEQLQLNVPLLRRRVPNLTVAAKAAGLRPATVSNLCTGKIPIGRAEVRTLATLAALAGCTLDELIIRGSGLGVIETGVKTLDLFAPVVRGGTVGLVARPGMGQLVLLAELLQRLGQRGYATVFWLPGEDGIGIKDVVTASEFTCSSFEEVQAMVMQLRNDRDVILAADREVVLSGELLTLRQQLQGPGERPVTTVLVDSRGEAVDVDLPYGPLDTLWRFDMDLTSRRLFPALDPISSTSTILEGAQLEATHLTIQQRARKLLRRYRELRALVTVHGTDKLPANDVETYQRGERMEAFLTQPFYIAEPVTKKKGEWLTLQETLEDIRRILDGNLDDIEPSALQYIGRLEAANH